MYLVGLGAALLLLKYLETGPTAQWDWWQCLLPFGAAVAWWWWADESGWTKKKAMEREMARKQARIEKNKIAMGTPQPKNRK
jgi:small Trp-rich protein